MRKGGGGREEGDQDEEEGGFSMGEISLDALLSF